MQKFLNNELYSGGTDKFLYPIPMHDRLVIGHFQSMISGTNWTLTSRHGPKRFVWSLSCIKGNENDQIREVAGQDHCQLMKIPSHWCWTNKMRDEERVPVSIQRSNQETTKSKRTTPFILPKRDMKAIINNPLEMRGDGVFSTKQVFSKVTVSWFWTGYANIGVCKIFSFESLSKKSLHGWNIMHGSLDARLKHGRNSLTQFNRGGCILILIWIIQILRIIYKPK